MGKEKKSLIVAQLSSSSHSNLLALHIPVAPSATEQEHPAILPLSLSTGHSQCLNWSVPSRLLVHMCEVFHAAVLVLSHFIDYLFLGFNQMVLLNV